jgi:CheY-like chemotaxis protein
VLVIDDEPAVRDLFARILALGDLFPVEAESAEAALQLIQRGVRPDAVLLDLKMPGMGGLAFLLHFRSHPQYATVPVAIVTGDCHLTRPMQRALEVLDAEIHFKPLDLEGVLSLTTRLLDLGPQP